MLDLDPGVAGPHVCHGRFVVIQCHDSAGHIGDQIGAVALAAARFEDLAIDAPPGQPLIHHLMPAKPVVLLGQAGDGPLAGQG